MSTYRSDTIRIVKESLDNIARIDSLIENVLDHLAQNELCDITSEQKDELVTKLHIALTILYTLDSKTQDICPDQTYTKTWIRHSLTILAYLEQNAMGSSVV